METLSKDGTNRLNEKQCEVNKLHMLLGNITNDCSKLLQMVRNFIIVLYCYVNARVVEHGNRKN